MADLLRQASDAVKQHPFAALAVTHAVTSAAFVWAISDGKPLKWIAKKVFQAAMSAVPSSIVDAEQAKLRKTIEKSVIGHSLDGEQLWTELPAEGKSACCPRGAPCPRGPSLHDLTVGYRPIR